jgi:hypothetical protein
MIYDFGTHALCGAVSWGSGAVARADATAVRENLATVVEEDDAVAEKSPSLVGVVCDHLCCQMI